MLTPRWMVSSEEDGWEEEADKRLDEVHRPKPPLLSPAFFEEAGQSCDRGGASEKCIDLRALLADSRWDAGHCHVFLLHLYFPHTLHCPPFLPSDLSPATVLQLTSATVDCYAPLTLSQQPPTLDLPSALCSCSDDSYVLYECMISLSQSLCCPELLSRCEAVLCAVCRVSGADSAWNGLYLACKYQLADLSSVCVQAISEWTHTRERRPHCSAVCQCACAAVVQQQAIGLSLVQAASSCPPHSRHVECERGDGMARYSETRNSAQVQKRGSVSQTTART